MYGEIKIGQQSVAMAANAASPIFYKSIFHKDFLTQVQQDDPDPMLFAEMGYVMAMQSDHSIEEMTKLSQADYIEWLTQFEAMDIVTKTGEIGNLYFGQTKETSKAKKKEDRQTESTPQGSIS